MGTVNEEPRTGALRPVRLAEWSERGDVVVVECPKPAGPWYRELAAWLAWWTGPQRIRLDAVGSDCWRLFDGKTTLEEVTAAIAVTRPEDQENLDQRVSFFLRPLIDRRMIRLE